MRRTGAGPRRCGTLLAAFMLFTTIVGVEGGSAATNASVADFDGNGTYDVAVYRPNSGEWLVRNGTAVAWGALGDIPAPGDYDGTGTTDLAVFRPSTGVWFVRDGVTTPFGAAGDIATPGRYDADGDADIALFRPSSGTWFVQGATTTHFGAAGDAPTPGDYDGNGTTDISVFRPTTGVRYFAGSAPAVTWGTAGDIALPLANPAATSEVVLAAGDIASCSSSGDEATAALLDNHPVGTVATLGDNVYDNGTAAEFANCYDPSWGRHRARTRPSVGNHEYNTAGAAGYYGYFGVAAGDPAKGHYSYELGTWHVVVVNSNCGVVSCAAGGPQEAWLRADLAAHRATCTLAYWHHPRFSSGAVHGSQASMGAIWTALYDLGADVVLAGHEHTYERFAPLDPAGVADPSRGVRSFVVGTGGRSHYTFGTPLPASEVRNGDTYGILALTLRSTDYDWRFIPEAGRTFTDTGTGSCHS